MRAAAVQLRNQVRERHRLAELLEAAARRHRHPVRSQSDDGTHGSPVRALRRAPRPCLRRRAEADRASLLHERTGAELPSGADRLGDDPQLAALAWRRIADHSEFGLEPLELALLRLTRLLGIALFDLGFLPGLLPEKGDGEAMAEDLVTAEPQLGFGPFRKTVAQLGQFLDEIVEGHMVRNVDEILYASFH